MIHVRIIVWAAFMGCIAYVVDSGPHVFGLILALCAAVLFGLVEVGELRAWWRQRRHDEMLADSVATRMKGSLRGSD